ncbi:erythromycin esterase family protein [Oceanirhabdus sp. W0125-5]|uniref:erythromycin esterase family protein n=1 Tax=Oceanirhabdus sp. W0125-5 TaxID=2999116 RepID=UPI0022F308DF|nr:erythromycin esterase family protein [Oceanirhabdus sp. W0125-5]WBW96457.1 erythromycin esterase family protein [Oceanirhabdus sp. W0125-5]
MGKKGKGLLILSFLLCTMMLFGCDKEKYEAIDTIHNNIGFKYSGEFVDLSPIEDDLKDNMIFFVGESHGMRENFIIKKEFVLYMKENNNFKYLLSEESPADAYLHNKYLKTGDITIIDDMFKNLEGTFSWNKDSYEFLKWMYEYNQTLPEEDRITYVGSDIVHQFGTGLKVLQEVLNNYEVPDEIKAEVEKINSMKCYDKWIGHENTVKLAGNSKALLEKIEDNKEVYSKKYGEDFVYLHGILKGIVSGIEAYDNENGEFFNFTQYRDKAMYEIFNIYFEHLPEGKYFGQWGDAHAYQNSPTEVKWFATYLNEDQRYKDKIITVQLSYYNSKRMGKKRGGYTKEKYDNFTKINILTTKNYNEKNKLYKLNEEGSVFSKGLNFKFNPYLIPTEGVTTDYVQYFIKIEDAIPTEPLEK